MCIRDSPDTPWLGALDRAREARGTQRARAAERLGALDLVRGLGEPQLGIVLAARGGVDVDEGDGVGDEYHGILLLSRMVDIQRVKTRVHRFRSAEPDEIRRPRVPTGLRGLRISSGSAERKR